MSSCKSNTYVSIEKAKEFTKKYNDNYNYDITLLSAL